MALSSSNAAKQLSDGNSQGTIFGQSSSDKISFYNATPSARLGLMAAASFSTAVSSTGAFGFGDAATASSVIHAVLHLKTLGLLG
jgi:hypothetical protein